MESTLFRQIQQLLERTYTRAGIDLEECLIGRERCRQLTAAAGASARELDDSARTFLRTASGRLHIGIYYSAWLIDQLEQNDPRRGIGDHNIRQLIAFVEEINHALHAALRFRDGDTRLHSEDFARNLELQAQVDTYLILILFTAFFRKTRRIAQADRRWLRFHLFQRRVSPGAYRDANLRARYLETTELARRYTAFLDTLAASRRIEEIRRFHCLDYPAKKEQILALPPPPSP